MVVLVVTRETSDDANAFVVTERSVWPQVSRVGRAYAYHASTDSQMWQVIHSFGPGGDLKTTGSGFEAQSPTGEG